MRCGIRLLVQGVLVVLAIGFLTFQVLLSNNKSTWKRVIALKSIPNPFKRRSEQDATESHLKEVKNIALLSFEEIETDGLNKSGEMKDNICMDSLQRRKVPVDDNTQQSKLSYSSLMETVYTKIGFKPQLSCQTKPWLSLVHNQQFKPDFCQKVFQNWLNINTYVPLLYCPDEIPKELVPEFTLFSSHKAGKYILDNIRKVPNHRVWDDGTLKNHMDIVNLREKFYYGEETKIVYAALENIAAELKGKKVATIGSEQPWLEAILMSKEVGHITVMEYEQITIEVENIYYMHPRDVAANYLDNPKSPELQFDAIVSFGTLMVSGTGRYGDVIDPWGDVREMMKSWCMLREGGLVLFGVPHGIDQIVWNAQRIYGPIRLPIMTAGFEVLKVFTFDGTIPWENLGDEDWLYSLGKQTQYIVMARKIVS